MQNVVHELLLEAHEQRPYIPANMKTCRVDICRAKSLAQYVFHVIQYLDAIGEEDGIQHNRWTVFEASCGS